MSNTLGSMTEAMSRGTSFKEQTRIKEGFYTFEIAILKITHVIHYPVA